MWAVQQRGKQCIWLNTCMYEEKKSSTPLYGLWKQINESLIFNDCEEIYHLIGQLKK